jgi:hypothetical protein
MIDWIALIVACIALIPTISGFLVYFLYKPQISGEYFKRSEQGLRISSSEDKLVIYHDHPSLRNYDGTLIIKNKNGDTVIEDATLLYEKHLSAFEGFFIIGASYPIEFGEIRYNGKEYFKQKISLNVKVEKRSAVVFHIAFPKSPGKPFEELDKKILLECRAISIPEFVRVFGIRPGRFIQIVNLS